MANSFKLQAILSAVDGLSPTLQKIAKATRGFKAEFARAGRGAIPMAVGLGAAFLGPVKAFADLENASVQLQNTLMRKGGGVPAIFDTIQKQAIELGNQLPGTTADFMSMASSLNALGVSGESIAGGALKATAFLAVVGKDKGVTYEQAAESIGKLGNALGIASNDLVPFADSLQRTLHLGVGLDQMQLAMSRVGGLLKPLGKQGLEAANELIPLNALLIRSGMSGEEAGTGLRKLISVFAMKGKFKGIPEMVKSLEKMGKMNPQKLLEIFKKIFGEEHATKALTIAAGGYAKINEEMKAQGSLDERVKNALGTLLNMWEAATGTITNLGAAIGKVFGPDLKSVAESINSMAGNTMEWVGKNKELVKTLASLSTGFVGIKLGFYGIALAFGGVLKLWNMSPFGRLLAILQIVGPLIITYWDQISGVIQRTVETIRKSITELIELIEKFTGKLSTNLGHSEVRLLEQQLAAKDSERKLIQSAKSSSGELSVNFNNAPSGMRVSPGTSVGGIRISPNVGYRSFATGMP